MTRPVVQKLWLPALHLAGSHSDLAPRRVRKRVPESERRSSLTRAHQGVHGSWTWVRGRPHPTSRQPVPRAEAALKAHSKRSLQV